MQEETRCDHTNDLMDSDTWEIIAEPAFGRNPAGADTFSHVLFVLKTAIASGRVGRLQAAAALSEGIKTAYLYTSEHKLARQLYEMYLTGHLKPENEPRQLLEGAIERGKAEIKRALALEQRRQRRRAKTRRR